MALNIATLKTRSLTAVVFVAVMLVGLLWNFWSFLILFTIVHFGCWYELVKLMKKIYAEKYLQYSLLGLFYITMPILMLISMRTIWSDFEGFKVISDYGNTIPMAILFSI